MRSMEKIKNEEKINNVLHVSIKCGWRKKDTDNALQHKYNAFIGEQNL